MFWKAEYGIELDGIKSKVAAENSEAKFRFLDMQHADFGSSLDDGLVTFRHFQLLFQERGEIQPPPVISMISMISSKYDK